MYHHIPRLYTLGVSEVKVLIPPIVGLEEDRVSVFGSGENLQHCALVLKADADLWSQGWESLGIRQHLDRPFVDAYQEYAGVEAVPVFSDEEVDVEKRGRWKECCPRDFGVQKNGICVKPAIAVGIS